MQNADVPPQDRSAGPAADRTTVLTADLREALLRYAEQGGFTLAADTHAWYAAADTVTGPEEARAASTVLAEVRGCDLNVLREAAALLAGEAALREPTTLTEVLTLLALLRRVRETATTLRTGAYEADLDALAAATANGSWRKERGLRISWGRRRKLRAEAKRLAVADRPRREALHVALIAAAAERAEWQALSPAPGSTARPVDAELLESTGLAADTLAGALRGLGRLLADRELTELPFAELGELIDALAADEGTLYRLPELRTLHATLEEGGLTELLTELAAARADSAEALTAYLRFEGGDADEDEDEEAAEAATAAAVAEVAEAEGEGGEVEAEVEIELPAQATAEPVITVEAEAEAEVEAVLPAQAVAEPELEPAAESQVEAEVEPVAEIEPVAELEPETAPEPVAEVEPQVAAEPEVEPEVVAEPELEVEPEAEAEAESESEPEAVAEPELEVEPAADAVVDPVVEPEPEPEAEPEAELEAVEAAPSAEAAPEPAIAPEPVAEAVVPVEEPVAVEPSVEEPAAPVEEPAAEAVAPVEEPPAEEPATDEPAAKRSRRPKKPELAPGRPITAYSADELLALVRWIDSDYVERTDDELLRAAMKELGFARLGPRIKEALATAVTAARTAE
ncbi:hypothetical protein [Kitasatospora sp. NBC_01266]|uniref:hypothetical protein n=1 Tax=Kitasatospora sp. NBC_01266 TaxID=2903572 RepID=UPI002E33A331|nr:hypothetical protein [Kitasatospora sp. NBC_01266]